LCGSGVGMSIAANEFKGIYAAPVPDVEIARIVKEHNNANILVVGADKVDEKEIAKMITAWLTAEFQGRRHKKKN